MKKLITIITLSSTLFLSTVHATEQIDVESLKSSLTYYEKLENPTNIAIYSKHLGKYYDSIKNYDEAVYYYKKEAEAWKNAGHESWGYEDLIRVKEIESFIEYYVKTDEIDYTLAQFEPKHGYYAGIYADLDDAVRFDIDKIDDIYGTHSTILYYHNFNTYISDRNIDVEQIQEDQYYLQLALQPMNGLDDVQENEWLINFAEELESIDLPIFLRYASEMNGDWLAWDGDPVKYKEKFILVHDVMEKYAPNVIMVWAPYETPMELNGNKIEDFYPGDEYVDWVGVNFYVDYYESGETDKKDNFLQNPLSHLDHIYNTYSDRKPIMIPETAVSHKSIPNDLHVTDWAVENMKKLYSYLPVKYPRMKSITYFNVDQGDELYQVGNVWNDYYMPNKPEVLDTYTTLLEGESVINTMDEVIDFTYKPITEEEVKNHNNITFFIKIPDYKINKVEYYVDDVLVKTDIQMPFSLNYDLQEKNKLNIKVYDSTDTLVKDKVINLK